jgi:hypothetical protein
MRAKFGAEDSSDLIVSFGKTELTQEAVRQSWRTMTLSAAESGLSMRDKRYLEMMTNVENLATAGITRAHYHVEVEDVGESIGDSRRAVDRKKVKSILQRVLMARLTERIREMNLSKKVKATVSLVEDEDSELWEKQETKELMRTARTVTGGIGRVRVGTEKETLRMLQRYPHQVFTTRRQRREYTIEFAMRMISGLRGEEVRDEIPEEKDRYEEVEKTKKKPAVKKVKKDWKGGKKVTLKERQPTREKKSANLSDTDSEKAEGEERSLQRSGSRETREREEEHRITDWRRSRSSWTKVARMGRSKNDKAAAGRVPTEGERGNGGQSKSKRKRKRKEDRERTRRRRTESEKECILGKLER